MHIECRIQGVQIVHPTAQSFHEAERLTICYLAPKWGTARTARALNISKRKVQMVVAAERPDAGSRARPRARPPASPGNSIWQRLGQTWRGGRNGKV